MHPCCAAERKLIFLRQGPLHAKARIPERGGRRGARGLAIATILLSGTRLTASGPSEAHHHRRRGAGGAVGRLRAHAGGSSRHDPRGTNPARWTGAHASRPVSRRTVRRSRRRACAESPSLHDRVRRAVRPHTRPLRAGRVFRLLRPRTTDAREAGAGRRVAVRSDTRAAQAWTPWHAPEVHPVGVRRAGRCDGSEVAARGAAREVRPDEPVRFLAQPRRVCRSGRLTEPRRHRRPRGGVVGAIHAAQPGAQSELHALQQDPGRDGPVASSLRDAAVRHRSGTRPTASRVRAASCRPFRSVRTPGA
jgi:hypothetical protein